MVTRQAVWPQELIDRRAVAAELLRTLRQAEQAAPIGGSRESPRVLSLRAQVAALPCPHWDLDQHAGGVNDWTCAACDAVITPEWVPLDEQERYLRRLRGRRMAALTDGTVVVARVQRSVPAS